MSAHELRLVAAAAGISERAVELALQELEARAHASVPARGPTWFRPFSGRAWLVALGAALGYLGIQADGPGLGSALAVFGPSAAVALYRAFWHRRRGSLMEYEREMLLMFGGFAIAIYAAGGLMGIPIVLVWAVICSVVGAGVVELTVRSNERPGDTPPEPRR